MPSLRRWHAVIVLAVLVALVSVALPGAPSRAADPGPGEGLHLDPDGYIRTWLLHGPHRYGKLPLAYPKEAPTPGFERDFLAETGPVPEAASRGEARAGGGWRPYLSPTPSVALRDAFGVSFKEGTHVVGYAFVEIVTDRPVNGFLRLGSDDGSRVWLHGREVMALRDPGSHAAFIDRLSAPVSLKAGSTPLLVKIDQRRGAWRFSVRLCDARDRPLAGVRLRLPDDGSRGARTALAQALIDGMVVDVNAELVANGFDFHAAVSGYEVLPKHLPLRLGLPARPGIPARDVVLPGANPNQTVAVRLKPGRARAATAITLKLAGAETRTVAMERPYLKISHAAVVDAQELLEKLRVDAPELFIPRPTPRLGVWAEAGADGGPPLAAPGGMPAGTRRDALSVSTLEWFNNEVRALLEAGDDDVAFIHRRTVELKRLAKAVRGDRNPLRGRKGAMLLAYRSRWDGSVQHFALYVPREYRPTAGAKRFPLYVGLHGLRGKAGRYLRYMAGVPLGEDETKEEADRAFPDSPEIPDPGAFLLAPYGRGEIAYRGIGEEDVLTAIEIVMERFPIDRDRVHLTGGSMGGIGVFELGVHRPDIWAGLVPLAGAADVRMYTSMKGKPLTPFEEPLSEIYAAVEWAANLRHLPMWCVHGSRDSTNPSTRSRVLIDRLRTLGYKGVRYEEPPLEHNVWDYTYAAGRLFREHTPKRVAYPTRVTFTSADLFYASAYWVRIDGRDRSDLFATIDARRDARKRRIEVTTTNVTALSLLLNDKVVKGSAPVTVVVDGAEVFSGAPPASGTLHFGRRRVTDAFFVRDRPGAPGLPESAKRAGFDGPLASSRNRPRLFSWATGDDAMARVSRRLAESLAAPPGLHGSRVPARPDWAVTWEDLRRYDLVAIGNPKTHWVLAAAGDRLPVRVEKDALVVADHRFVGLDVGAVMVRANPLVAGRKLIAYLGVSPAAVGLARHLPRYLPDFVIYDRSVASMTGGSVLDERRVLWGGFFSADWRFPSR